MGTRSEALLTPSQVARLLGVSADTVRAWADGGRLDCLRTEAGHRLFRRDEVERFRRRRSERSSGPEAGEQVEVGGADGKSWSGPSAPR